MATRQLKTLEQQEAWKVFRSSVDYSTVRIADDLGLQERPWCSPPGWGGLPWFCLHVGTTNFNGNMKVLNPGLLIHEMTHVWQGQHNLPFWYVINSGCNQVSASIGGGSAYSVNSQTGQWKDYGAEQQGSIVQGWYTSGMSSTDWRFRFIRDNVRPGAPMALSQSTVTPSFNRLTPASLNLSRVTGTLFRRIR